MRVRWRTLVTIGLVVLLLAPLARTGDGVPLSSYPMYAHPRSAQTTFVVAVGTAMNGEQIALSAFEIAGTADPLIAETYLRREVAGGRVQSLCATIASRVAGDDLIAIEIRSERHDVVDRVLDRSPPLSAELLASCPAS